jgi:hypothetical protein
MSHAGGRLGLPAGRESGALLVKIQTQAQKLLRPGKAFVTKERCGPAGESAFALCHSKSR